MVKSITMKKKVHKGEIDPVGARFVGMVTEDHRAPVYAVAFWPHARDGGIHHLAVAGANRASVYAVSAADRDELGGRCCELRQVYVDNDEGESFFCACWSAALGGGGRDRSPRLALGGARGIAKIVDCGTGSLDVALSGHGNALNDACFHPIDACLLLTASKDESVRLWNAKTAVCVAVFAGDRGHRDEVLSVDAHCSGAAFCSSGMDNTVKVWQLDTPPVARAIAQSHANPRPKNRKPFGTVFEQFPAFSSSRVHANYVDCARWAGSLLLSKSTANRIAVWTPDLGDAARSPLGASSRPDGDGGGARDAGAGAGAADGDGALVLHELALPDADIWFLRFCVDAKKRLCAAGNKFGRVLVWDVDKPGAKPLAKLAHHRAAAAVRQVAFAPDSRLVAFSCDDASVFLFELDAAAPA